MFAYGAPPSRSEATRRAPRGARTYWPRWYRGASSSMRRGTEVRPVPGPVGKRKPPGGQVGLR